MLEYEKFKNKTDAASICMSASGYQCTYEIRENVLTRRRSVHIVIVNIPGEIRHCNFNYTRADYFFDSFCFALNSEKRKKKRCLLFIMKL